MTQAPHHDDPAAFHIGRWSSQPFTFGPLAAAGALVVGRGCYLAGWSVIETTGAAVAEVDFFDGHDTTGQPVAFVGLTAGQSSRDATLFHGIALQRGLFVNVLAGTVKGVVWVVLT